MNGLTFIHCGDIHLDARFTGTGLSASKAKQRRQELRDTFSYIIDQVIEHQAQLLFISGDLFEHEYTAKSTVDFVIKQFQRIPRIRIFISPGNHDPYVANSYYAMLRWPDNVYIFTNLLEHVYLPEYDTTVYGVGFTSKYQYDSMLEAVPSYQLEQSQTSNILVVHGTLDNIGDECPYHPIRRNELIKYGFDYIALGHFHTAAIHDHIVYCGSPEPLGFDESGKHGIIKGEFLHGVVKTQFIQTNQRECTTIKIDISGMDDSDQVEQHIRDKLQSKQSDIIRIILTGRKKQNIELDIELIRCRQESLCYNLIVIDDTWPDYQLDELRVQHNLKGVFVRKMLEAIEHAADEQEEGKLYKALYLGLDALSI